VSNDLKSIKNWGGVFPTLIFEDTPPVFYTLLADFDR